MSSFIKINDHIFPTLLAQTKREQERGLMGVKWPPPIMSFVYGQPCINKFWMSNTVSPLDIIFSLNGKITQIHKGEPYSTRIIGLDELSDLVIEMPYGSCQKFGIGIGAVVLPFFKL